MSLNQGGAVTFESQVHLEAGATLRLGAGSFSLEAASVTGTGTLQVAGSFSNTTSVVQTGETTLAGDLSLVGGTLFANGTLNVASYSQIAANAWLSGTGAVNVAGTARWSAGSIEGSGTIVFASDLAIDTSASKIIRGGRVIETRGTTTWSGATAANTNDFYTGPGTIRNIGTWIDANAFSTIVREWYVGGPLVFQNGGTYRKTGPGTTTLVVDFRNTGSIDVRAGVLSLNAGGSVASGAAVHLEAGAMLRFAAGNFSLDTVTISGTGTLQVAGSFSNTTSVVQTGEMTLAGDLSLVGGTLFANGTLNVATYRQTATNAWLSGTGTLIITGTGSQWTSGMMTGGGTTRVAAGAELTIGGSAGKNLGSRTIVNDGSLIESSTSGILEFDGAVVLENNGLLEIRTDTRWDHATGPAGSLTLINSGSIRKTGGSGDFEFRDATISGSGAVEVLSGRILVNGVPV